MTSKNKNNSIESEADITAQDKAHESIKDTSQAPNQEIKKEREQNGVIRG